MALVKYLLAQSNWLKKWREFSWQTRIFRKRNQSKQKTLGCQLKTTVMVRNCLSCPSHNVNNFVSLLILILIFHVIVIRKSQDGIGTCLCMSYLAKQFVKRTRFLSTDKGALQHSKAGPKCQIKSKKRSLKRNLPRQTQNSKDPSPLPKNKKWKRWLVRVNS